VDLPTLQLPHIRSKDSVSFIRSHGEAECVFAVGEHARGLGILAAASKLAGELGSISSDDVEFVSGFDCAVSDCVHTLLISRVLCGEIGALLASSVAVFRRLKNILTGSLYVGLTELQLLIHVIFNGVKLLSQGEVVSRRIRIINPR